MDVTDIEARFGLKLPGRHRAALLDPSDPIHDACDFLLLESQHELLDIGLVNGFLHRDGSWNQWPNFLVAFASNGCGDYYAYDLRTPAPAIVYIDPDRTVIENLEALDQLTYPSFDIWYRATVAHRVDPTDMPGIVDRVGDRHRWR